MLEYAAMSNTPYFQSQKKLSICRIRTFSRTMLSYKTFCIYGNVYKSVLFNSSHLWPLNNWTTTRETKKLTFKFCYDN